MDELGVSPAGALPGTVAVPLPAPQARAPANPDRVPLLAWLIAGVFVAVELALSDRYGFLDDEMYFIVSGHHLALGYVDQPPLTPLIARVMTSVLGTSPPAVRILPAACGGAVVIIAAMFAALFGGRRLGRVIAALTTACAFVIVAIAHLGITETADLLAWSVVLLCVATAVLRDRPRWWLGAGVAAGLGLQDNNVMVLLLAGLAGGVLVSGRAGVLRTVWPWLGAGIAAVIWAPNVVWQAMNGWPQLTMASVIHQQNSTLADYLQAVPAQLGYAGLAVPLLIAGFVWLWRTRELLFLGVTATLVAVYVIAWVPGKEYYAQGTAPMLLAAGSVAAERWIARARRPQTLRAVVIAAPLVSVIVAMPLLVPVLPLGDLHDIPVPLQDYSVVVDTVGWRQLASAVAAQDTALARSGHPPTAIFTGNYGQASGLEVLGSADHLPPVLSGNDSYWTWGAGRASDTEVLTLDSLGWLRPYFARCRMLTVYHAPYDVQNDYTNLQIGVCSGPVAGWPALWPHLRHYN